MRRLAIAILLFGCSSKSAAPNVSPGNPWPERRPAHAIALDRLALVPNEGTDEVTLLDLGAGFESTRIAASLPLEGDPIDPEGPHTIAIDASGTYGYVPFVYPHPPETVGPHGGGGHHGVPTGAGTLRKVRLSDLAIMGTVALAPYPGDVKLTLDGKRAIVTHHDLPAAQAAAVEKRSVESARPPIAIVDTDTLQIVAAPKLCMAPQGIAVAEDRIFVACYGEDAIGVLPLAGGEGTLHHLREWKLPPYVNLGPFDLVLARDGKSLVVAETEGHEVRRIDVATMKTVAQTEMGSAVPSIASDESESKWIAVTRGPDRVVALDASLKEVSAREFALDECERPRKIARQGARWFVVCEGDGVAKGALLEIDPSSLATLRRFEMGVAPRTIAFAKR